MRRFIGFGLSFVVAYLLGAAAVASGQDTEIVGVPWRGDPGITETVSDIMAREHAQGSGKPEGQHIPPRGHIPDKGNQNAGSDKTGPTQSGTIVDEFGLPGVLDAKTVDTPSVFDAQTARTSFVGPRSGTDSNFYPPDSMGAVGPGNQLVVATNGRIRTYDKSGNADLFLDTTMDNFFASVGGCPPPAQPCTSDPRVIFDRISQRWFVSIINTTNSTLAITKVQNSGSQFKITTASAHGLTTGLAVSINGGTFTPLTAAWIVTVVDSTSFTLNNSTFQSGWTSGGYLQQTNRIMIAMSGTANINGPSSFTFFQFTQDWVGPQTNQGFPGNVDTGNFADFPTLGTDNNGLYIGTNMFSADLTTYQGSTVYAIKKSDFLAGTLTVTAFRHILGGSTGGMASPIAATNTDSAATFAYFVGTDPSSLVVLLYRLMKYNTDGTFSLPSSQNFPFNVNTAVPKVVPAMGSTPSLDGLDRRIISAQVVNGSLWAAQGILVNATGAASSSGDRDAVRFYEITDLTGVKVVCPVSAPCIRQSGNLFDSSATNPMFYWAGSIATSGQGHSLVASSYAGASAWAGVAFAGRLSGDALGTLSAPTVVVGGGGPYNAQTSSPQRWGDYSAVVVDPADNMTFWSFQEYANSTNTWGIQVTQYKAPPPATPSVALPASGPAGATTSVTITGLSTAGSGFYDPGSGFPNHISASISGGGVTVNSVTYTNPTTITLNVTIASNASQTLRTVTVTNPDAQSATSTTGIFQITAPELITLSPASGNLPTATLAVPAVQYSTTITATGGTPPYIFTVSSGSLPSGLALSVTTTTTAVISGIPTTSGTQTFTIQAMDALSVTGSTTYTLKVASQITNNFGLAITSRTYDVNNPPPGYVGKYTLSTTLTNQGSAINSAIYLKITAITMNVPGASNKLEGTDLGTGVAGDTKQIVSSLGAGQSTPLTLLFDIGARVSFNFLFDVYTVLPGSAMTTVSQTSFFKPLAMVSTLQDPSFTGSADTASSGTPVLLGQFQIEVADAIPPATPGDSDLNADPLSNVGIITGSGPQSRPAVAVDPIVSSRIAVAATDFATRTVRVSTSQDGGLTWHATTLGHSTLNQNFIIAEEPSLAFDQLGRLSVVYMLANPFDSSNAIVISESTDGIKFSSPTAITFHPASERVIDSQPVIAIKSGAGRYVAWDSLSLTTLRYSINVARSEEGGIFGPVTTVVSDGLVSSPALALSKNHVYVGWDDWGFNSTPPYNTGGRLMIASAPAGPPTLNFDNPREIARTSIGFGQKIAAMPEKGAGPNLSLAADSKRENIVYAVFADRGNGMDIRFARSNNRGNTWQITTVNDDGTAADQFSPSMAVDDDSNISIGFYDTRLSSTFQGTHTFLATSVNGGPFENRRITTAASNDSTTNVFRDFTDNLGDRTGIAIASGKPVVVWTDTRLGSEDAFLSVVNVNQ